MMFEAEPSSAVDTREQFRIGRRTGQQLWQIKERPGWKVIHQAKSLVDCVAWLRAQGYSISNIPVTSAGTWRLLTEWVALGKEPS